MPRLPSPRSVRAAVRRGTGNRRGTASPGRSHSAEQGEGAPPVGAVDAGHGLNQKQIAAKITAAGYEVSRQAIGTWLDAKKSNAGKTGTSEPIAAEAVVRCGRSRTPFTSRRLKPRRASADFPCNPSALAYDGHRGSGCYRADMRSLPHIPALSSRSPTRWGWQTVKPLGHGCGISANWQIFGIPPVRPAPTRRSHRTELPDGGKLQGGGEGL